MQFFSSLDQIVESARNNFHFLMKFGDKKHLKQMQKGKIYMKRLKFYNDLEEKTGKTDRFDGKWKLEGAELLVYNGLMKTPFLIGKSNDVTVSFGYENNPVLCLFCFDKRNMFNYINENDYIKFICGFTDKQKQELENDFGESVLVILDTDEFIKRISSVFTRNGIIYRYGLISYNTGNSEDRIKSIFQNSSNIVFNKDLIFNYQQEFRILITNRAVEDHFEIDGVDLSDISKIYQTKEFLQNQFEYHQHYSIKE